MPTGRTAALPYFDYRTRGRQINGIGEPVSINQLPGGGELRGVLALDRGLASGDVGTGEAGGTEVAAGWEMG